MVWLMYRDETPRILKSLLQVKYEHASFSQGLGFRGWGLDTPFLKRLMRVHHGYAGFGIEGLGFGVSILGSRSWDFRLRG